MICESGLIFRIHVGKQNWVFVFQKICDQWDRLGTLTAQRRQGLDVSKYLRAHLSNFIMVDVSAFN